MRMDTRPRFRPDLVELEARDVPAWYNVAAPTPAEGTAGSTDATHAGELRFSGEYTLDANGMAAVWADTPMQAVTTALYGTITATLNEETVEYPFNANTVGTPADQKAFAVVISGTTVSVALEDLAGFPDVTSDWDYDDRTWGGVTVESTADPVVETGSWTWVNPGVGETATVQFKVTRPDEETFRWEYKVTNNSLTTAVYSPGIRYLQLSVEDGSQVRDMTTDMEGWTMSAADRTIGWVLPCYTDGPYLEIGGTARFGFDTPPLPITASSGYLRLAAEGEVGGVSTVAMADTRTDSPIEDPTTRCVTADAHGEGAAKGPGVVRVVITYADNTEVAQDKGLRVAKLENSFKVTSPTATSATVAPPDPNFANRDFIDLDPDRFHVWVYDLAKWSAVDENDLPVVPRIMAGVQTDAESVIVDDLTMVDLVRVYRAPGGEFVRGWYKSDSQVLMSNTVDDKYDATNVVQVDDWTPGVFGLNKWERFRVSDRTHRAILGGHVVAKYEIVPRAFASSKEYTVPVRNYVKVAITSLSVGGKALLSRPAADEYIRRANEQLAQVGIKLVAKYNPPLGAVTGVNLGQQGFDLPYTTADGKKVISFTAETAAILDNMAYRTAATDDIEIFYVNSLYDRQHEPLPGQPRDPRYPEYPAAAMAIPEVAAKKPLDANVILVAASSKLRPFTWPHEIGHVLLDAHHYDDAMRQINLMKLGTSLADVITAAKRLFASQDNRIRDVSFEPLHATPPPGWS